MTTPRFGLFGTKGPAPRWSWGEVRCRDGYLPSLPGLRRNTVITAVLQNRLRNIVAKAYNVPAAHVFIIANSWVRSAPYNATIGGEDNSYHTPRRKYWKRTRTFVTWAGRRIARRFYVYKGCSAIDVQIIIVHNGRRRKVAPAKVAEFANRLDAYRNGGIGVYPTFTHLDHRGYKARW